MDNNNIFPTFAFYQKNIALMNKRTLAVLGQIDGTIPSTWEAQELEHQKLIDCTDVDLSKMGDCGDFE